MRFGVVILPELPWREIEPRWRQAEELGFDHAWTYDHLTWRSFRDAPWFGAVPTLTAAAMATERIRLGPLVASPNFRHPVPFAKELITLDDISGGRVTLGIGSGSPSWDATMLGHDPWSPRERADRFAEFVELCDRLLREPAVTYRGRFYAADEARTYPGCVQRPRLPFVVAATGPRAMRLVATYGQTWVTSGPREGEAPLGGADGAKAVAAQMALLDEACHETGRDPAALRRMVITGNALDAGLSSVEAFRDTAGHYEEVGVTDLVVHWPRDRHPHAADLATFERIFSSPRLS